MKKPGNSLYIEILGWVILVTVLVSGLSIYWIVDRNLVLTTILVALIILTVIFFNSFGKFQITFSRLLLGSLFIFSGFVKGVDPVGTQYRIEDYFIAFGTEWAIPFALPLSILLNTTEFVLGILLFFNIGMRITSWFVLVMMAVFTIVTLNDAINNPVPDCGCFGDAIKISNWQTFNKNLVIDALLLMVFLTRKRIPGWFNLKVEWVLAILFAAGFFYFQKYNIRHLPVIDFTDWKVGKKMVHKNPMPSQFYLTYKNKQSRETREYQSPNYPYNDSAWLAEWEFVSQRVVDPNPHLHDLHLEDDDGNDQTQAIIGNPNYQFILVSVDLLKASKKNSDRLKELNDFCDNSGISFAVITSSLPADTAEFNKRFRIAPDFYYGDDAVLKVMIRSNPGLILMENGLILDKWHYNDFPLPNEIKEKFPGIFE